MSRASGYHLFCSDNRDKVQQELGKVNGNIVTKKLAEMWRNLDEYEKDECARKAVEMAIRNNKPVQLKNSNYIELMNKSKTLPKDVKALAIDVFDETGFFHWATVQTLKDENLITNQ